MRYIILINIFLYVHHVFCANVDKKDLKSIIVLYRHGDRAPIRSFPNDLYFDEKYWPMGFAQLTNKGKLRHYNLGQWLKRTYKHFLPEKYSPNDIYVFSTNVDRTLMSAAANLAGLYSPVEKQKWSDEINWQPVPIHTDLRENNLILESQEQCPKFDQLFNETSQSEFFVKVNTKYSYLYEQLSNLTGWDVNDVYYFSQIKSIFHAYSNYNASFIPSWYHNFNKNDIEYLASLRFVKSSFTPELARLSGGVFFHKMFKYFDSVIENDNGNHTTLNNPKLLMYSAHDDTIVKILNIMQVFNYKIPEYASMVIWELYSNDGRYHVNLSYKQNETYVEKLTLNGCNFDCDYSVFKNLLEHVTLDPADRNEVCSIEY